MTTKIEAIWESETRQAETLPIEAGAFRLTRLGDRLGHDIYAGLDDGLHAILGLGVSIRPPAIVLESGALDYFRRQRADGSWLLVLRLKRRGLETVFGRLCQDLADSALLVKTEDALVALFVERLRLWERLFSGSDDGLLPKHKIRGLIGELLVLERLLVAHSASIGEIIESWVGPQGQDQDFRLAEQSIEVKTINPGARSVGISSLRQLAAQVPLSLTLVTLGASVANSEKAVCLNSLVDRLESRIASEPASLLTFRERLLAAGYVDQERYGEDWFVAVREDTFAVTAGFPKLVPSDVVPAITGATYELDIAALSGFRVEFPAA
ncbi:PD-(D/E)XK motif protein [Acidovorax sp. ACV01]|uniref:PD-(D/E)XK motif protein n=1 Tax=Acidovorax sp. ACV01 TaxID=2769311 RepID=UPI001786A7D5|nr:PD-(D/E)XK motif protein [Acidovorax sp. ACV01]MBD9393964.1 PD-(D/E)XK motif protein [Acidovorax sp. ACV01]